MNIVEEYTQFKRHELLNIPGVYSIKCKITDKLYIGETISLYHRFTYHLRRLLNNKHDNPYLQEAVNKYGLAAFELDVIEICEIKDLQRREHHWVHVLYSNQRNTGYNIRDTHPDEKLRITDDQRRRMVEAQSKRTDNRKNVSAETRAKISAIHKGKKIPKEVVDRMRTQAGTERRERQARYREIKELTGKAPVSEKFLTSIRAAMAKREYKKGKEHARSKAIIKYNLDGKFMAVYSCIREADNRDGYSSVIVKCCKGKCKMSLGYIWRYYTDNYPLQIEPYTGKMSKYCKK